MSGADNVYTLLRENVLAGLHCSFGLDVKVTGTVMLEDCVTIHKSASLHGFLYIECDVQIGEYSQVGMPGALSPEFTWVRAGARIGHHCQIASGVIIGQGAWLEPFSQVDCDVPAGAQAGGSPLILRGYLCGRCGSLLSAPVRQIECCTAEIPSGAGLSSHPVEQAEQQIQLICRVCGDPHLFTAQQWRWVGRELPSAGEHRQADKLATPAGLRRFMQW
jgi:hypothetical protein